METILFFNDQKLQIRENAYRCQGRARLIPEGTYLDPAQDKVNLAWGYPSVFHDEKEGRYLLYYQGWPVDHVALPSVLPLMAQSKDGLHWRPLELVQDGCGENWLLPNQYLPRLVQGATFAEAQVYVDKRARPQERLKALTLYKLGDFRFASYLFVSSDGIHWKHKKGVAWHAGEDAPDYPLGIYYNDKRRSYCITARPAHCDRRIAIRETVDWEVFSAPEMLLEPDYMDPEVSDLYGMPVFPYADGYIGFLEVFSPTPYAEHRGEKVSGMATHKFLDGNVQCQLAYSYDGHSFQRFMRKPLIELEDESNIECSCVYPTCLVEKEDSLLLYASVSFQEHGRIPAGKGAIVAYSLRKDGLAYLRANRGYSRLLTKGLLLANGKISFNVCSTGGDFRVQICTPQG
ncbi:MAG: hypothetical protein RR821_07805, partial [Clostridia bacterium]